MTRTTPESLTRTLGRRVAQVTLAGAIAATPLGMAAVMAPAAHAETDWDALAECESSGNWSTNTGNGFGGGLQFTPSTWKAYGGSGSAQNASREEQIVVAEKVKAGQGMGAWPTCSKKTGQTSSAANSDSGSDSGSEKQTLRKTESSSSESSSSEKSEKSESSGSESSPAPKPAEKAATSADYTVVAGDTLSSIVAAQSVTDGVSGLAERNGITDPDRIMVGQSLDLR